MTFVTSSSSWRGVVELAELSSSTTIWTVWKVDLSRWVAPTHAADTHVIINRPQITYGGDTSKICGRDLVNYSVLKAVHHLGLSCDLILVTMFYDGFRFWHIARSSRVHHTRSRHESLLEFKLLRLGGWKVCWMRVQLHVWTSSARARAGDHKLNIFLQGRV